MKHLAEYISESTKISHDEKRMALSTTGGRLTYHEFPITIETNLDAFELETVFVERSARGRGIGKDLVKEFIKYACNEKRDIVLCASVLDIDDGKMSNDQLIQWYKSLGFKHLDNFPADILWYDHKTPIKESILDDEDTIMDKGTSKAMLDKFESMRAKYGSVRRTNAPLDMFGREIKIGDICFAYIVMEHHFIQVKDIVRDKSGWYDIIPTADYSYMDKDYSICPGQCIIIPKDQYANFLKIIK